MVVLAADAVITPRSGNDAVVANDELKAFVEYDAVPNNEPVKLPVNEPVVFVGANEALRAYELLIANDEVVANEALIALEELTAKDADVANDELTA